VSFDIEASRQHHQIVSAIKAYVSCWVVGWCGALLISDVLNPALEEMTELDALHCSQFGAGYA
jgi:hypothetical protein